MMNATLQKPDLFSLTVLFSPTRTAFNLKEQQKEARAKFESAEKAFAQCASDEQLGTLRTLTEQWLDACGICVKFEEALAALLAEKTKAFDQYPDPHDKEFIKWLEDCIEVSNGTGPLYERLSDTIDVISRHAHNDAIELCQKIWSSRHNSPALQKKIYDKWEKLIRDLTPLGAIATAARGSHYVCVGSHAYSDKAVDLCLYLITDRLGLSDAIDALREKAADARSSSGSAIHRRSLDKWLELVRRQESRDPQLALRACQAAISTPSSKPDLKQAAEALEQEIRARIEPAGPAP